MVRIFQVYFPGRTLLLFSGEALIICSSFLLATLIRFGPDSYLVLNYENGLYKILLVTTCALLCAYYSDLYAPQQLNSKGETYFRMLLALGFLSLLLSGISYLFPHFMLGAGVYLVGLFILTIAVYLWRAAYSWLLLKPFLRERVYVLGTGERASLLVDSLAKRKDLGMDVVGWTGETQARAQSPEDRDLLAESLTELKAQKTLQRVIVCLQDRRGKMPVKELLDLRLSGVKIEQASTLVEKITGKIEVDDLYPSSFIFSEGFRLNSTMLLLRRTLSILVSFAALVVTAPLLPFIVLAIRVTSPGPILFRQERVGRKGKSFTLFKFRTMRQDAEVETGPVWAGKDDPRVTVVGSFLRKTRLDEIPQLWNVFKGDMAFVGPRPERPEFVQWLATVVPYYHLRHIIRPGVTGWAQVKYQYGSSLEDTKQKLQYDLYYMKHMSLALDLWIIFQTVKTVILRRGAQ